MTEIDWEGFSLFPADQQVLCVPSSHLAGMDTPLEGFVPHSQANLLTGILRNAEFVARRQAELDASWKQVIPYVVILCGSRVFKYTRLETSGELRLIASESLAVSGHIDLDDGLGLCACPTWLNTEPILSELDRLGLPHSNPLIAGLIRELEEEIAVVGSGSCRLLGYISDPNDDVGRFHLGVVFILELCEGSYALPRSGPNPELDGQMEELSVVFQNSEPLEPWSRILLHELDQLV